MNWLDIVITVAIIVLAFVGWKLGLLKSLLIVVGVIADRHRGRASERAAGRRR